MIPIVAVTETVKNLALWVAELIGFLLLVWFFVSKRFGSQRKSVIGMIGGILDARASRIDALLRAAEESREEARLAHEQVQAEIAEAHREAEAIVLRAQAMSTSLREEAVVTAEADKQRIIAQARDEIEAEQSQALMELRSRAADVAIDAAQEVLRRTMNDQSDRRIIETALADDGSLDDGLSGSLRP